MQMKRKEDMPYIYDNSHQNPTYAMWLFHPFGKGQKLLYKRRGVLGQRKSTIHESEPWKFLLHLARSIVLISCIICEFVICEFVIKFLLNTIRPIVSRPHSLWICACESCSWMQLDSQCWIGNNQQLNPATSSPPWSLRTCWTWGQVGLFSVKISIPFMQHTVESGLSALQKSLHS